MHELKNRAAMHDLMEKKGFRKKSGAAAESFNNNERRAEQAKGADASRNKQTQRPINPKPNLRGPLSEDRKHEIRHAMLTNLHKKREEGGSAAALLRRREKEQLLAMAAPQNSTMFYLSLLGGAAAVGVSIIGIMSRKNKKIRGNVRK